MRTAQRWDDVGRREPDFIDDFRAFCQLLAGCRMRAESLKSSALPDASMEEAEAIRSRLLEALEAQGLTASRESGPYGYELYREVQYVQAVLADELLLAFDWPGRDFWTTHMLEAQLFNSHTAGDAFFVRVERLLGDRNTGPEGLELLYFVALSVGFQGKYRDRQDQSALSRYKRELYRRYYFKSPTGVQKLQYAFPDCYEHTLDSFIPRKLPSPKRWVIIFLAAAFTWLIISQVVWSSLTGDLHDSMNSLIPLSSPILSGVARGN